MSAILGAILVPGLWLVGTKPGAKALGSLDVTWILAALALGGLLLGARLGPDLRRRLRRVRIEPGTVTLTNGVKVHFQSEDLVELWPVYVELSTRVAANSLQIRMASGEVEHIGGHAAAVDSLYTLFRTTRERLAAAGPPEAAWALDEQGEKEGLRLRTWVLRSLNHGLRPFLSRWHPWVEAWQATGLAEHRWADVAAFRADLENTRQVVERIVTDMGEVFEGPRLTADDVSRRIQDPGLLADWAPRGVPPRARSWSPRIDAARHVALAALRTRVPSRPVEGTPEALRALLASWRKLSETLGEQVVAMGPIPRDAVRAEGEPFPDEAFARLRSEVLEPLLLAWSARAEGWKAGAPPAAEVAACREACEQARKELLDGSAALATWT